MGGLGAGRGLGLGTKPSYWFPDGRQVPQIPLLVHLAEKQGLVLPILPRREHRVLYMTQGQPVFLNQ